jgi:carbonic anhydrase
MKAWLTIAEEARQAVKSQLSNKSEEEQITACERESVIISMRNLFGYPYIMERFKQKKLNIFGWHFNAEEGEIIAYNAGNGAFEAIS